MSIYTDLTRDMAHLHYKSRAIASSLGDCICDDLQRALLHHITALMAQWLQTCHARMQYAIQIRLQITTWQ